MASIKRLFNEITTIHPEKVKVLGIDGLEKELNQKLNLLAKELWESLSISDNFQMPSISDDIMIGLCYHTSDLLGAHLETLNESIKNISLIYKAIQERLKSDSINLKTKTKMPIHFQDTIIDGTTGTVSVCFDALTGESNVDMACRAMGLPSSPTKLAEWGDMLFSAHTSATQRFEDFIRTTASFIMTEDEIKKIINHNEFEGVYFPNLYKNETQLAKLCKELISRNYLHEETSIEDFIYFFSGEGNTPEHHLTWYGNQVVLGVFLDCYFIKVSHEIPNKWKISQKIFSRKGLRQSLNNAKNSTSEELMNKRYELFTDILESI